MTKKQKRRLLRIGIAALLFAGAIAWRAFGPAVGNRRYITHAAFLIPYLIIGFPVLKKAAGRIVRGQVFDENFLMAVASIGALAIGEYPEAVFVLLFYEIGELFESIAVGRSRRSVSSLMDIRPDSAVVMRDGVPVTVTPEEVAVGEIIVVRPGEKIPLDGVVTEGRSSVYTAALTGEPAPRDTAVGDEVISGCVNGSGRLLVRTSKPYGESTAARILRLVEESAAVKAGSERFITRFAAVYTPVVVTAALALAVIPSLITGAWSVWVYRALSFLVISCPCALVISVPLAYFAGIGAASRNGILVKGSQYLEKIASVGIAVFDKTGTLTEGRFSVTALHPASRPKEELLSLATHAEGDSLHPIAVSLREAYGRALDRRRIGTVTDLPGRGVKTAVDGRPVYAGNGKLMEEIGASAPSDGCEGTLVHVAREEDGTSRYLGHIVVSDTLKPGTREALLSLKKRGVNELVLLTGDTMASAARTVSDLPFNEIHASLLPDGKVGEVEALLRRKPKGKTLLFVGDGMNDAPVLARADVGVAMGALGSDAAIEAADIVVMDDDLRRLDKAVAIGRKTQAIVRQNIVFSLAVKLLVLILSAFGLTSMWVAAFADVGVMILAVLNAMRTLRT